MPDAIFANVCFVRELPEGWLFDGVQIAETLEGRLKHAQTLEEILRGVEEFPLSEKALTHRNKIISQWRAFRFSKIIDSVSSTFLRSKPYGVGGFWGLGVLEATTILLSTLAILLKFSLTSLSSFFSTSFFWVVGITRSRRCLTWTLGIGFIYGLGSLTAGRLYIRGGLLLDFLLAWSPVAFW